MIQAEICAITSSRSVTDTLHFPKLQFPKLSSNTGFSLHP